MKSNILICNIHNKFLWKLLLICRYFVMCICDPVKNLYSECKKRTLVKQYSYKFTGFALKACKSKKALWFTLFNMSQNRLELVLSRLHLVLLAMIQFLWKRMPTDHLRCTCIFLHLIQSWFKMRTLYARHFPEIIVERTLYGLQKYMSWRIRARVFSHLQWVWRCLLV